MRRRDFIAGIGGAVAMPLRARAQQPAMPTIGYLAFSDRTGDVAAGFSKALNQAGYIEGRNVRIEVHSADRQPARLPELFVRQGGTTIINKITTNTAEIASIRIYARALQSQLRSRG
jgi:putative tryptophan/tyrosine transport system substrate-binding protein